ncbi:MAG: hypothetical protein ACE5E5_04465 [Phycisphaerae bacterium]
MISHLLGAVLVTCVPPSAAQVVVETRPPEPVSAEKNVAEKIAPLQLVPLDDALAKEVDELIPRLGSVEYLDRKEATERLIQIGAGALAKLRDAYLATDDLEVLLRIEQITESVYLEHHVYSRKAFLGISLTPYDPRRIEGPPLPIDTPAVTLTNVIAGTAAANAGLQIGDVVIESDGLPLSDLRDPEDTKKGITQRFPVVTNFSRGIARHRPGDHLRLKIMRGTELLDVDVVLGFLPESMRKRSNVAAINEALIPARQSYAAWWKRHFAAKP